MPNQIALKEKFLEQYGPDTYQLVSAHQSFMPYEVADWWLAEIAAREERLVEKAEKQIEILKKSDSIAEMHHAYQGGVVHGMERVVKIIKSNE